MLILQEVQNKTGCSIAIPAKAYPTQKDHEVGVRGPPEKIELFWELILDRVVFIRCHITVDNSNNWQNSWMPPTGNKKTRHFGHKGS